MWRPLARALVVLKTTFSPSQSTQTMLVRGSQCGVTTPTTAKFAASKYRAWSAVSVAIGLLSVWRLDRGGATFCSRERVTVCSHAAGNETGRARYSARGPLPPRDTLLLARFLYEAGSEPSMVAGDTQETMVFAT